MWNLKRWMVMGAAVLVSGSIALAQSDKSDQVLAGPRSHQKAAKGEKAGGEMSGEKMGPRGGKEGEGRGDFLKETLEELNLTQDQKTKIQSMMQDFHQKMQAFRSAHEGKAQELREQMKAARDAGDKDKARQVAQQMEELKKDAPKPKELIDNIKTVLTPDQAATLESKVDARRKQFAENHPEAAKRLEGKKGERGERLEKSGKKGESGDKKLNH